MTWEPGDLALCINATPKPGTSPSLLEVGLEYTVLAVYKNPFYALGLILEEVSPPDNMPAFLASRFIKATSLTRRERDEFLTDLEFDADVAARLLKYGKVIR